MGTRSLTFVYDEQEPIINMYRQYDGYPTGHGAELAEFLTQFTMVNGLGINETRKVANGMPCLAAQLVAHFKSEAGGFYLYPTSTVDCGQDYEYHVYHNGSEGLRVKITDRGCNMFGLTMSDKNDSIFDGTVAEFTAFCTEKEEA
jgi:hypothetical protein